MPTTDKESAAKSGVEKESMGERLERYLKTKNLTQSELARLAGVKQQTISYIINSKSSGSSYAVRIASALGINPVWLQEGVGTPHDPAVGGSNSGGVTTLRASWIPKLKMSSEIESFLSGLELPEEQMTYVVTTAPVKERAFAMEVEGRSMEPDFKAGDEIVVDPAIYPEPGDFVIAAAANVYALRKFRVLKAKSDGIDFSLVPSNPDFPEVTNVADPTLRIVGTVVEHRRTLRASRR